MNNLSEEEIITHHSMHYKCRPIPQSDGIVSVWEPPIAGEQYVIGADVAEGLTGADSSVGQVMKMYHVRNRIYLEQVAKISGWITPTQYGTELVKLGHWYNDAVLAIEKNGPGHTVISRAKDLMYLNLYVPVSEIQTRDKFSAEYGVTTSSATKPVMISLLHGAINDTKLAPASFIIRDALTLKELTIFIQVPLSTTYRYEAMGSGHDDCVMALAIANYVVRQGDIYHFREESEKSAIPEMSEYDKGTWKFMQQQQLPEDDEAYMIDMGFYEGE